LNSHCLPSWRASCPTGDGAWGYDLAGADKTTHAGDDFFRFANGTWLDYAQIPADKPAISLRLLMTDRTDPASRLDRRGCGEGPYQPADLEAGARLGKGRVHTSNNGLSVQAITREFVKVNLNYQHCF
jgi:hypothetical protein